ncbi:cytochrome bd-type quinol oxidase subunit 2 [Nocardiopsis mwathae]|uniref:Cytochrome bd-type quinol oxidase subunit 2 n=1 Tax=Nocardiopsis mwathae TaxID=1472723 RepID=A0A7W9YLX6_9ACTN|nr:hypothetical protein [Nocardiopsis mwathae]MBB6173606.1 cytochrome bd-type quinol oxidase subunit 2 [Nocardiopsis mwathae]
MSDISVSRSGPGRVLVAVYAVFALAATARATVQILTRFEEAPLAYLLSALAGVIYIVATVGIARSGRTSHRVAFASCAIELAGVLVVGAFSVLDPAAFPDDTVWSNFGSGYLYIPLVLPVLGLLWLRHVRALERAREDGADADVDKAREVGGTAS